MDTPSESNSTERSEPTVVEVMLDRPMGQVAQFAGRSATVWGRGLVDPWGLGSAIASGSAKLRTPFAFLVVAMFVTGIATRLWLSIEAVPASSEASLLSDLRSALDDVSLTRITLVTLPCVLIVAAGGYLLSRLVGKQGAWREDRVVAAAFYAAGWQSLVMAVVCGLFMAMQAAGWEPTGALNDEMNQILPVVALVVVVWGALMVTPAMRARLSCPRWWKSLLCLASSGAVGATTLVFSLWVLGESIDLREAARLADERQIETWRRENDLWIGQMQADVLQWRELPGVAVVGAERFELTVAYTSRVKQLLVVPRQEAFAANERFGKKFPTQPLRVVASSLDDAPDRALLLPAGETRVVEYTVESAPLLIGANWPLNAKAAPYWVEYHCRDDAGYFVKGRANLLAPRELVAPRVANRGTATRTAR